MSIEEVPDVLTIPSTLFDGVLIQRRDLHTCIAKQFPSSIRGIPQRQWNFEWEFECSAMAVDPSQDLVVAFEVREEL